tara:strand:+ start:1293 stop:2150 length:858 start_codon:yes stop_codon:yes gene_type:complete
MTTNDKIFQVLEETNTNWNVNKLPLVAIESNDHNLLNTETYGLFRSDNNNWLGSVGNRYEVMPNHELAEIMVGIQDRFGGEILGGQLQGGKKIYYQMTLPSERIGNDVIKRNITCLNSHDGTSSIGFGSTNVVVSCSNMFHRAMKDLSRFRHTMSASERLAIAVTEFQKALDTDRALMDDFQKMSQIQIDETILEKVMGSVFNVDMKSKVSDNSTRKRNQVSQFEVALAKETREKGGTLWGLFNAVTYYTNHLEKKQDLNYLMYGSGYKKNLTAFNTIKKYMEIA